jgi:hypothetical protein
MIYSLLLAQYTGCRLAWPTECLSVRKEKVWARPQVQGKNQISRPTHAENRTPSPQLSGEGDLKDYTPRREYFRLT